MKLISILKLCVNFIIKVHSYAAKEIIYADLQINTNPAQSIPKSNEVADDKVIYTDMISMNSLDSKA